MKTLDLQSIKYGSCGSISVLMDCVRFALTAFFLFLVYKNTISSILLFLVYKNTISNFEKFFRL